MRVAIVNDLAVVTEVLRRIVTSDPDHVVVWTALEGTEAIRRCDEDPPDVILMDLLMPIMNGAEATREIMKRTPCPILVVTTTVTGNYPLVCQALGFGAYDAVNAPTLGQQSPREAGAEFLAKLNRVEKIGRQLGSSGSLVSLRTAAGAKPDQKSTSGISTDELRPKPEQPGFRSVIKPASERLCPLVVIGASTGGPPALEAILTGLPPDFPGAVVVIQHIDRDFTPALVSWLAERCKLRVVAASNGDRPTAGTVLVAATNDHLVFTAERTLAYSHEPRDCPFRPSVDAMYESLIQHWPQPGVAVLLTGIGRDGADGMLKLRQRGWFTIAQDQASSIVYGMPKAAAQNGAAKFVLPLRHISGHIISHLRHR